MTGLICHLGGRLLQAYSASSSESNCAIASLNDAANASFAEEALDAGHGPAGPVRGGSVAPPEAELAAAGGHDLVGDEPQLADPRRGPVPGRALQPAVEDGGRQRTGGAALPPGGRP